MHSLTEALPTTLVAGTRVGEYEITGVLGAGGMGTVYAGVHPVIGKRVAIKVIKPGLSSDPRMVDRFVREARAVVKIQHHNIIDVFSFGREDGVGYYFVMPLLEGQSLEQRVADRGPLPPAEVVSIVAQIAAALDAAHAEGIYHRDLKPDNVFLARERGGGDTVRVLDFGIAKLMDGEVSTTRTGVQMGTPLYMSPEQWDGASVDHRTDVYALGVLVHHALTGRHPFESTSPVALMNMHANQEPMPASRYGADPAVDPVIARALAKDREQRLESAGALYRALAEALGAPSARGAPAATAEPATGAPISAAAPTAGGSPAGRRWGIALAVVAAFAAAGVAAALVVISGGPDGAGAPVFDAAPAPEPEPDAPVAPVAPATEVADAGLDAGGFPAAEPPAPDARPPVTTRPDRPGPRPKPRPEPEPKPKPKPKPGPGDDTKWGEPVKPF